MAMMAEPTVSKTRVCIKNIPPRTTERDLKEFLLSEQSKQSRKTREAGNDDDEGTLRLQITDCKILKNAQGKSRKVAFVGFRQPEQAAHVVEKFHRTYLNMSRITVEAATAKRDEARDDDEKDGKNRNHKPDVSGNEVDLKPAKHDPKDKKKASDDSKVEEFLSLMGAGKSKSKFWSNDATGEGEAAVAQQEKSDSDDSDSDSSDSSDSDSDEDDQSIPEVKDKKSNDGKTTGTGLSDMDFLRSKTKQVDDLDEPENDDRSESDKSTSSSSSSSSSSSDDSDDEDVKMNDDRDQENNLPEYKEVHDGNNDENMEDGGDDDDDDAQQLAAATGATKTRLFVRNLAFETTEEELEEYFSPFGKLTECHIPVDDQRRNKGYAFVTFESAVDAIEALNQLDKVDFQGRLLHILQARPPPQATAAAHANDKNLTWKQKQELARKEQETKGATGEASQGWSASFVRGDAVVDNLADRLGLRKGDILGVKDKLSSGDAAVRLALGETQIIEENREYFRQHGVDMEALVSANEGTNDNQSGSAASKKRSKTAILVKNLPFDTRVDELEKLFHVGQEPVNILLPPSKTIALIEYGHSTDAKRAFRKLAYRRFKHVPIYLEWAPLQAKQVQSNNKNSSSKDGTPIQNEEPATKTVENRDGFDESSDLVDVGENEDGSDGVSSTLYVKNLNFETTEESLQEIFEKQIGRYVLSVRIPRKVAPTKSGSATSDNRSLSMGYGFVELASHDVAKKAMKMLQGRLVDGYSLQLALSSQKQSSRSKASATPTGKKLPTKLMVRNVPFQATRTEILKLFGTFGQLKKVRLPKKFDGSHRGFAFVEYLTGKEAMAAMNSLSRTHLYGRHLVIEWASVEEENDSSKNMDRLRDKAKRDATGAAVASAEQKRKNKKIRFE
jgi:multiple RNA-binding domain-containing protein 1